MVNNSHWIIKIKYCSRFFILISLTYDHTLDCTTVSYNDEKFTLVFIDEGTKVNSVVYIQLLEDDVLPWMTKVLGDNYVSLLDGAPSHTFNVIQQL